MSWGMFAGYAAKMLDKWMPTRKQRRNNVLKTLEKAYAKALRDGRDTDAARIAKWMRELRVENRDIDQS